MSFDFQANHIIRKILKDARRFSTAGAVFDRNGDYVSDLSHDHGQMLISYGLAVGVHRRMSAAQIRYRVGRMRLTRTR